MTTDFPSDLPVTDAIPKNCVVLNALEWRLVIDVLKLVPPVSIVPSNARYPYKPNPFP
jgi:hypothetical protein